MRPPWQRDCTEGRWNERWQRHEDRWQRREERWQRRGERWRRVVPGGPWPGCSDLSGVRPWWRMHAGLHWRIFIGFGVAIAISAGLASCIFYLSDGRARAVLLIPVGVVLWFASGAIAFRLIRPLFQVIRVARDIGDG